MNSQNIIPLVFFILFTASLAKAQQMYMPPSNISILETMIDYFNPEDNIFFIDPESNTLFIDFQSVKDQIVRIEVKQNDQLLFEKDVRHLMPQTIYELPAYLFDLGDYKIEIQTDIGFRYSQEIKIENTLNRTFSYNK